MKEKWKHGYGDAVAPFERRRFSPLGYSTLPTGPVARRRSVWCLEFGSSLGALVAPKRRAKADGRLELRFQRWRSFRKMCDCGIPLGRDAKWVTQILPRRGPPPQKRTNKKSWTAKYGHLFAISRNPRA